MEGFHTPSVVAIDIAETPLNTVLRIPGVGEQFSSARNAYPCGWLLTAAEGCSKGEHKSNLSCFLTRASDDVELVQGAVLGHDGSFLKVV